MADPDMPNKVMEGRVEDVRPCLACMQGCTDRTWAQLDLTCLVNPSAGREQKWSVLKPAETRKRILVVGGGPAGMETARIAALRGHDVTLWEQSDVLGGTALLAAMPPRREEFGELPRWLISQMPKAGVKVHTGQTATFDKVKQFAPDVLVAASGARPEIPEHIPGFDLPHVTNVYDLLSGKHQAGGRVLMVGHDTQAVEAAEWLSEQGKTVYLISGYESQAWDDPESALANDINGFTGRYVMMGFVRQEVNFMPFMMVKRIEPGFVTISRTGEQHPCTTHVRNGELEDRQLEVDTVVIHLRMRPVRSWLDGLEKVVPHIIKVGDCLEPRKAIDAMADGGRVGREI